MLSKIKKISSWIKRVSVVALILGSAFLFYVGTIYVSYTQGQMDACNAMLRNDPQTKTLGLYCEQMPEGIVVRSTVLKRSLFNITFDKVYFSLGD